jgi:curved DNA-binding protein CbpA
MHTNADSQPEQRATTDLYEILQVSPKAEQEVIEAAYKRLALKYHPDLNPTPEATRRMQELNAAYAILSDPIRRAEYDQEQRPENTPRSSRHPRNASYVRRHRRNKAQPQPAPETVAGTEDFDATETFRPDEPAPADSSTETEADYAQWYTEADTTTEREREWAYVEPRSRWLTPVLVTLILLIGLSFGIIFFVNNQTASGNLAPNRNAVLASSLPDNVLFEDDLDTVAGANWILDPPWHLTERLAASGSHSLWVGEEARNGYRPQLNASATLVRPVDLSNTQNPLIRFRLSGQFDSEVAPNGRDRLFVEVAETGHDFETAFSISGSYPTWQDMLVDLSKWKGKTVVIRFRFNTGPSIVPVFSGPFIDDIRIEK